MKINKDCFDNCANTQCWKYAQDCVPFEECGFIPIDKELSMEGCRMNLKEYRKTKKGILQRIYSNQRRNSRARNYQYPNYTLDELREWCFNQKKFHVLHNIWRKSEYNRWFAPSCDRIDDYKPYTLDNLQLMTWKENADKGHVDRKNGVNNKGSKAVIQLTKTRQKFVAGYNSMREASRYTGVSQSHISRCCSGSRKSAGGFKWEYKHSKNETG